MTYKNIDIRKAIRGLMQNFKRGYLQGSKYRHLQLEILQDIEFTLVEKAKIFRDCLLNLNSL